MMRMEEEAGKAFVEKYHGFRRLTDSFLDSSAETLVAQAAYSGKNGWPKLPYYLTCLMMFLTMFRSTRAAEVLSTNGYPMQGYSLMRGVKDQVWTMCGAVTGLATFAELFGWDGVTTEKWGEEDRARIVANRRKTEARVRELIVGKKSGLSEETQTWLLKWERMFNGEAHRGIYTLMRASSQMVDRDGTGFSLVAPPDELLDAMFLNRSTEINWMILRVLPFARRSETKDDKWAEKWKILDESFAFMVKGLADIGKKIAPAFIELLDTKFKFDPSVFYSEPAPEEKGKAG